MKLKSLFYFILPMLLCSCVYSSSDSESYDEEYDDESSNSTALDDGVDDGVGFADAQKIALKPGLRGISGSGDDTHEWPSPALIAADLTGHSLSEGVDDGYHRPDWKFDIEYGNVSDLTVLDELVKSDSKYLVIAEMKLSKGGNFYYLTKARINYVRGDDGSPVLDYVTSLGMKVVSDGEFDDAVTARIADDGWGGVNCLKIRNKIDMTLVVGGQFRNSRGWKKFSCVIEPHGEATIGGTFEGGSVTDYQLDFVVREL